MKNVSKLFYTLLLGTALGVVLFAQFQSTTAFIVGVFISILGSSLVSVMPFARGLSFNSFVWIDKEGNFKHLTSDQMKTLDIDSQLKYAEAREKFSMDNLQEMHENYRKAKEKGESLDSLILEIKDEQTKQSEAQKELNAILLQVVKNGKINNSKTYKSDFEELRDSIKESLPSLSKSLKDRTPGFLTIKAPGTITRPSNIVGANSDDLPRPEYVQGLNLIPERNPFITELLDNGSSSSPVIVYVEEKNPEGDFEMTPEGSLKPIIDFEIEPARSRAKKTTGRMKISDEMLEDIDFMASEINSRLRKKHDLKLEDSVLNGDGTGEEFDGIVNQSPAFTAGSLAASIVSPNNSDVIRAAINQVVVSSDGAFYPTRVAVHPDDAAAMDLQKDSQGAYVLPPFQSSNGRIVAGVQVIEKTKIPTGYFMVGDFSVGKFRNYKPFYISMGWENDDFTKNLVSVLGESRNHFYIMSNDLSGLVYDQFAVAKAALLKP